MQVCLHGGMRPFTWWCQDHGTPFCRRSGPGRWPATGAAHSMSRAKRDRVTLISELCVVTRRSGTDMNERGSRGEWVKRSVLRGDDECLSEVERNNNLEGLRG